ncbi:MAG TPA: TetR family transcriptional regulator [Solirubrobacteraceae bacterium]|nr:TetR family transcriptional regulator [Solirubrobacteraceae bacterium]
MASRAGVRRHGQSTVARSRAAARRGDDSRAQVSEMQRSRLLAAAVRTVDELGYASATVAPITQRARVSRRTFYELFANREECVAAVLEDAARRIGAEIERAGLGGRPWRERVRGGLWAILSFFDREPVLARVCVVQALRGSQAVLERREEILRGLARVLDEGRGESARGQGCPPLTAEGLVGAAFAIVYARLLRGDSEPLTCLLPELMGMIVLPYLGPAAARREQALPVPASTSGSAARDGVAPRVEHDPLEGIPMRLTYRTARVLEDVAEHPGVSNRMVAELSGIVDQGQVSKLLARLERLGLLQNMGEGHVRGERNAWRLTGRGVQVTQTISAHAHNNGEVA